MEPPGDSFSLAKVTQVYILRVLEHRVCVWWWDNFNRLFRRQMRTSESNRLEICNWTAQGLMYDATVDTQVNTFRWRNSAVVSAMPRDPLIYKQPVEAAIHRAVGATSRRNGEVPDWVAGAVCLQIEITRVPLKPPIGAVFNGVVVDVEAEGLKTFVPIGIKPLNIGKNTDLGLLLREFMVKQGYPFSTDPTQAELANCRYSWINVDVGNFSRMYKVHYFLVLFCSV